MNNTQSLGLVGAAQSLGLAGASSEQKIREAAKGFEAVLVRQMLRELRQTSWSKSQSDINSGYLQIGDEHLANHIVHSGGLGFAKAMASQMLQQIQKARLIEGAETAVKAK